MAKEITPEQEIQNKIDQLLNNKKKEVKKYNNNPASKQEHKTSKSPDRESKYVTMNHS